MYENNFEKIQMPSLIDGLFGSEKTFNIFLEDAKAYIAQNNIDLNAENIVRLLSARAEVPRMTKEEKEKLTQKIAKIIIGDKQKEKMLAQVYKDEKEEAIRSGDYVDEKDMSNVKKEERIPQIKEKNLRDDHEI